MAMVAEEKLINTRLAYVSVSRARDDAQIYTNDAVRLGEALSKEVSKASALEFETSSGPTRSEEHASEGQRVPHEFKRFPVEREQAGGHSMGF